MKIDLGKALKSIARVVKENPTKVIAAAVLLGGPVGRATAKIAPIIVAVTPKPVE